MKHLRMVWKIHDGNVKMTAKLRPEGRVIYTYNSRLVEQFYHKLKLAYYESIFLLDYGVTHTVGIILFKTVYLYCSTFMTLKSWELNDEEVLFDASFTAN